MEEVLFCVKLYIGIGIAIVAFALSRLRCKGEKNTYAKAERASDYAKAERASDYAKADNKRVRTMEEREKALTEMFSSDPRSASFLMNWKNGEHPMTSFIRQFGKDGLEELVTNEEKLDEFAKANEEYLAKVAKEKELEKEYHANLDASLKSIDEMQAKNGLSDEQVDEAMEMLVGIVRDGIMGKFTSESIQMAMKAINHDADVTQAADEAYVQGKNTKVEEKLRKRQSGDGTAALAGSNNAPTRPSRKLNFFDYAEAAQ